MSSPRIIALLLALITLVVYLPVTTAQFISYDDADYVSNNHMVQQGLTWEGVKWAFDGMHASNWHPLTWLSHMLDCDLFRVNPAGPHLVNALFHALNTALVFAFLFRLTRKMWPAALTAALFAWHPLHVESVAWIAERKDVLSTFFSLLTLLSYGRYVQEKRRCDYWLALLYFTLALLSKPMPVTLPLVMLLLDYWPMKRFSASWEAIKKSWPLIWEKIPFFLLSAGLCAVTMFVQKQAEASLTIIPLGLRVENAFVAYAGYLWKMIWPTELALFYPLESHLPWRGIMIAIIILAAISALVWRERGRCPWLMTGWLWYLVTLLPAIGLVQVGSQAMADRYTYLPSIGIFLALAFSLQAVIDRVESFKQWAVGVMVLILGVCVILTEKQLRYWHDNVALFQHSVTVVDSVVARIGLGAALNEENRTSEALHQFIMAAQLAPHMALVYEDIAQLLDGEGRTEESVGYYQLAVRYGWETAGYHDNYGVLLVRLKQFDAAQKEFSAAIQAEPAAAQPHFLMARLLLNQAQDAAAIAEFRRALQLDPGNVENLLFAASVLAADEDPHVRDGVSACVFAQAAVNLTHEQQPAALDVLAMAYAETGRLDDAVQTQQKALQLAKTAGEQDELPMLQKRLRCYEAKHAWREVFH